MHRIPLNHLQYIVRGHKAVWCLEAGQVRTVLSGAVDALHQLLDGAVARKGEGGGQGGGRDIHESRAVTWVHAGMGRVGLMGGMWHLYWCVCWGVGGANRLSTCTLRGARHFPPAACIYVADGQKCGYVL